MAEFLARRIINGYMTKEQVPPALRDAVYALLPQEPEEPVEVPAEAQKGGDPTKYLPLGRGVKRLILVQMT